MTASDRQMYDPMSRGHLHGRTQRRVKIGALIVALVLAMVLIPLMINEELRLDVFRAAGFVPSGEGELVADEDSGATLIVLPTEHQVEGTGRPQLRFLAAYLTWPQDGAMRLEPLNGGEDFTVPLSTYDHLSAAPDGNEMYLRGPDGAVLVDVADNEVIVELAADEAPPVDWEWQMPVWAEQTHLCDRVSNTATWIGCFERPELASYLAGDWQLNLEAYGGAEETHEVMRGLGFQPIIGFTADDAWLYVYNEYGIRRFEVAEITGS